MGCWTLGGEHLPDLPSVRYGADGTTEQQRSPCQKCRAVSQPVCAAAAVVSLEMTKVCVTNATVGKTAPPAVTQPPLARLNPKGPRRTISDGGRDVTV